MSTGVRNAILLSLRAHQRDNQMIKIRAYRSTRIFRQKARQLRISYVRAEFESEYSRAALRVCFVVSAAS